MTGALVTGAEPVVPEIGVGPVAASVQAVGTAVPPLSLVTVLTSVSVRRLVVVVDRAGDVAAVRHDHEAPVSVPPVQDQAPAV